MLEPTLLTVKKVAETGARLFLQRGGSVVARRSLSMFAQTEGGTTRGGLLSRVVRLARNPAVPIAYRPYTVAGRGTSRPAVLDVFPEWGTPVRTLVTRAGDNQDPPSLPSSRQVAFAKAAGLSPDLIQGFEEACQQHEGSKGRLVLQAMAGTVVCVDVPSAYKEVVSLFPEKVVQEEDGCISANFPIPLDSDLSAESLIPIGRRISTLLEQNGIRSSVNLEVDVIGTDMGDRKELRLMVTPFKKLTPFSPVAESVRRLSGHLTEVDVVKQVISIALADVPEVPGHVYSPDGLLSLEAPLSVNGEFYPSQPPTFKLYSLAAQRPLTVNCSGMSQALKVASSKQLLDLQLDYSREKSRVGGELGVLQVMKGVPLLVPEAVPFKLPASSEDAPITAQRLSTGGFSVALPFTGDRSRDGEPLLKEMAERVQGLMRFNDISGSVSLSYDSEDRLVVKFKKASPVFEGRLGAASHVREQLGNVSELSLFQQVVSIATASVPSVPGAVKHPTSILSLSLPDECPGHRKDQPPYDGDPLVFNL